MIYILQTAIHYSTGHYENAGIVREALIKMVYNSHLYQLSDNPEQRNMSKSDAYRNINRAIDNLIRKRYLEQKKTLDGRSVIYSTSMANKWFQRKIHGK